MFPREMMVDRGNCFQLFCPLTFFAFEDKSSAVPDTRRTKTKTTTVEFVYFEDQSQTGDPSLTLHDLILFLGLGKETIIITVTKKIMKKCSQLFLYNKEVYMDNIPFHCTCYCLVWTCCCCWDMLLLPFLFCAALLLLLSPPSSGSCSKHHEASTATHSSTTD